MHLFWITVTCSVVFIFPRSGVNYAVFVLPFTRLGNSAQTRVGLGSQWAVTSQVRTKSLLEIGLCVWYALPQTPGRKAETTPSISHRGDLVQGVGHLGVNKGHRYLWIRYK